MNRFFTDIFFLFLCCFSSSQTIRVICEFDSLATQREGTGRFTAENIDPSLCTHLVYSKASINALTFVLQVGNEKIDMIDKGYEKFVALKSRNPEIKLLISTGGWNVDEQLYRRIYSNQTNIQTFVKSAVDFLHKYKFDGLHFYLQFLYAPDHKNGVAELLIALQVAFRTTRFSISATVSPLPVAISTGYPISSFNDTLDFINVMAHSFHGPWEEKQADHHSRLYGSSLNADSAIQNWVGKGISLSKIILGIPLFGTSWNLQSNQTQPPAPANGGGQPGKILKQKGFLAYLEICDAVRNEGWKVFQDPTKNMGPYAVSPSISNRTWVGYDDPDMAIVKANYVLKNKLGGVSVWDVSQDDFLNTCGGGINPMLTAIAKTLKGITSSTTTTLTTSTVNDAEIGKKFKSTTIAIIVIASFLVTALLCSTFYISCKAYYR